MFDEFLVTFNVAILVMAFGYVFSRWRNYYSIVDVLWAYSFTPVAFLLVALKGASLSLWMLGMAMVCWSVRLGTHLLIRLKTHYPVEDGRYRDLKSKWAAHLHRNFFLFYLFQAVSVVALATPLVVVAAATHKDGVNDSHWTLYVGFFVSLMSWFGEAAADHQLAQFRKDPKNKGQVCEVGLWRFSRHPNYFFEWMIWVGFATMATTAPFGLLGWISPILMFCLLNYVTGVPYAEEQSLKSRGQKFVEYQNRVSAFFPWIPKRS
jgi:steroid 5-alpha reductase family enzyme